MICPNCQSPNLQIQNTRHREPTSVSRWRKCLDCHRNFKTKEVIVTENNTFTGQECKPVESRDGPGFEQWLTPGLPYDTNVGELRRGYEAGLSRIEAMARARVQRVSQ